jgi:hypothetical protein
MSSKSSNTEQTSHFAVDPGDRVLTFAEWCQLNRISASTGRRVIARGDGPTITRLSDRRIGITARNDREWKNRRGES